MRGLFVCGAFALAWALGSQCGSAAAEVRLSGTLDRMTLQANDATVGEILDEMRAAFHVDIDLRGDSARRMTGRYSGSARQVLSRVLKGEDYVVRFGPDRISIRLLGASAADRRAAVATATGLPQTWEGSRLVALRQGKLKRTDE
jgi:hypothetical protein